MQIFKFFNFLRNFQKISQENIEKVIQKKFENNGAEIRKIMGQKLGK